MSPITYMDGLAFVLMEVSALAARGKNDQRSSTAMNPVGHDND